MEPIFWGRPGGIVNAKHAATRKMASITTLNDSIRCALPLIFNLFAVDTKTNPISTEANETTEKSSRKTFISIVFQRNSRISKMIRKKNKQNIIRTCDNIQKRSEIARAKKKRVFLLRITISHRSDNNKSKPTSNWKSFSIINCCPVQILIFGKRVRFHFFLFYLICDVVAFI